MSDLHTQPKVTAQPNHFTSLRGFLAALDQMNDLQEVRREVDTDLEIGAIIRRTHETYAPAPLFTNIRGHTGYRVVGAPLSYSSLPHARMARVALALGLDPETSPRHIVDALARASTLTPVPPVVVEYGACQQNVHTGDDVDLTKFPSPMIHDGDGGRYFNTLRVLGGAQPRWDVDQLVHSPSHGASMVIV